MVQQPTVKTAGEAVAVTPEGSTAAEAGLSILDTSHPARWTARQAAAAIHAGEIKSEQLVKACLERISGIDDKVQAWTFLDRDYALEQARKADLVRAEGRPLGPLHGLPVAIKDIFDTKDMPTEDGTPLHAGRRPVYDATAVALLRAAGAVILGKTVTTELAYYSPGKTRNPHDLERTPGGSSSGSAAAVASCMAPLAIGSQTNGSVIRPAAYCGVVGFKPSHRAISRHGVLRLSRILDHVGVFARDVLDAALLSDALIAYDQNDPDTRPRAAPRLLEVASQPPPVLPRFAFVKTPVWDRADAIIHDAFGELVEHINQRAAAQEEYRIGTAVEPAVEEMELPAAFQQAHGWQQAIMEADMARSFAREYRDGKVGLSDAMCEALERGQSVLAVDYNRAVDGIGLLNRLLDEMFNHCDVLLTPATTGVAPQGLDGTGSPAFCTIWTLCGVPAATLPLLQGDNGLPIGVQLVGARGNDGRLLRTARWLAEIL